MQLFPVLPLLFSLSTLTLAKDNPYSLWRRYNHHHHLGMNCTARAVEPGQACLDENGKLTTKQTEATLVPPLGPRWGEKPEDRTGVELLSLYEKGEKGEKGRRVGTWGVWVNKGEDEERKKKLEKYQPSYDIELEEVLEKSIKESEERWREQHEQELKQKEDEDEDETEAKHDQEETVGKNVATGYELKEKPKKYQTDRDREWTRFDEEFWTREMIFPRVRGRRQRGRSCI